jgi:hypothetical protein
MNTQVEYKRPGRNRWGRYKSTTLFNQNGITGHIYIDLTWFNRLGWYYSVELTGWDHKVKSGPGMIILEYSKDKTMWRRGKELPLCAEAAEVEATKMCEAHGIVGLKFEPYVLRKLY